MRHDAGVNRMPAEKGDRAHRICAAAAGQHFLRNVFQPLQNRARTLFVNQVHNPFVDADARQKGVIHERLNVNQGIAHAKHVIRCHHVFLPQRRRGKTSVFLCASAGNARNYFRYFFTSRSSLARVSAGMTDGLVSSAYCNAFAQTQARSAEMRGTTV